MKSLFKNSIYNFTYKILSLLFPLISSIYVSRILMPQGVGKTSVVLNFISYFTVIAGLGMNHYGTREIGKLQNKKEEYEKKFYELFTIVFSFSILCLIIYLIIISTFPYFKDNYILYLAASIQLVFSAINVDWFYQGMEEYQYITCRSLVTKILCLVLLFCTVRNESNCLEYVIVSSLALAVNNLFNLFNLRKFIKFRKFSLKKLALAKHFKPLVILFVTNLAIDLYTKIDITMLGMMTTEVEVGYYSYASKLTSMIVTALASVCVVLLPRFSYLKKNNKLEEFSKIVSNAYKIILTLSIPSTIGLILVADSVIPILFGSEFIAAIPTVQILAILIVIKTVGNLFGTQILLSFNEEKKMFYTTLVGVVTNLSLNMILIPRYLILGAAIASVISELLVMITQFIFASKYVKCKLSSKFKLSVILPCIVMILGIIFIKHFTNDILVEFISSCIAGIILYMFLSFLLKNESILFVYNKFLSKVKRG